MSGPPNDLRALGEERLTPRPEPAPPASSSQAEAASEGRRFGAPRVDGPVGDSPAADDVPLAPLAEPVERVDPGSYGSEDVSRVKDFEQFTEEELERAKAMIATLRWNPGWRLTRRWAPGRGNALDLRRVVRRNIRYGGEPLVLPTRGRTVKRRPLVLICDVSGSMERYARMLLHFMHSLAGGLDRVEAFLFAARLTRITRELVLRRTSDAVPDIPRRVPGWGGGTRIGDALRTFNVRWANRVLGQGAVVLLISDGWDRGEPDLLRREMGRLQRSCHRLIWLNPLLGSAEYQPLTRGMQAALPFVDDFLPVHNLASLEALAEHLNRLPERRPERRAGLPAGRSDLAGFGLQAPEEPVHHHLRHRPEKPLTHARDESADLSLPCDVDDRRLLLGDELHRRLAHDEAGVPCPWTTSRYEWRWPLVEDRNSPRIAARHCRNRQRQVGPVPILADRFETVASRKAGRDDLGVVEQCPDGIGRRGERVRP